MVWSYFCRPCGVWRDYKDDGTQAMVAVKAGHKMIQIPVCSVCGVVSDCSVIPDKKIG